MWIFTPWGFYSISAQRGNTVQVRARSRTHLITLKRVFGGAEHALASARVISTPKADYPYRVILPKSVWARIVRQMACEQNWANFKNEAEKQTVGDLDGDFYVDALHDTWFRMRQFQQEGEEQWRPKRKPAQLKLVG